MIKNKTILITGGGGFLGSALAERLIKDNQIIIFDNFSRDSLMRYRKPLFEHGENMATIVGDVLNEYEVKCLTKAGKFDIVIHCAAIAGIDTVIKQPSETIKVNVIGTRNILDLARMHAVEHFVYFSTSEIFGRYSWKDQEDSAATIGSLKSVRWCYAASKLTAEHLVKSYFKDFEVPSTIVRPFNVYGPGQSGEGAIHTFIERARMDANIEINGDGAQVRSWCYVDDFTDAIYRILNGKEKVVGGVFNIGNPRATTTIRNLAEIVKWHLGSKSLIMHVGEIEADVEFRVPSIDKAKSELFWEPVVDLDEGIKKTIDWYVGEGE